ncbi:MAG: cation:proton antiporter, partial [Romboutsia sp.]|uniref:cation:proton antiporter n=1 Tax=Romboutsia sp. TaxID=1965302 RepID=UPI003F2F9102
KILNEVKITVALLASIGVIITAIFIGTSAHYILKLPIGASLLLGAIVSSTDPASLIPVFKQVHIKDKLKQTIISESAFNDAFGAILFTSILTGITLTEKVGPLKTSLELIFMILIGVLVGTGVALIGIGLSSDKRYGIFDDYGPIISVVIVIFAYEISERFGGSGYMSVFISGLVYGNKKRFGLWIPDESYVSGVHFRENIATISRMAIFIVLGSHLDINSLLKYGGPSLLLVLMLIFIARPIVVIICTSFDKKAAWSKNEKLFMMWVRETGVIPAALSGIVVSTKVNGYEIISSAVFMTIIITLLVQASTTGIVAKKLHVLKDE